MMSDLVKKLVSTTVSSEEELFLLQHLHSSLSSKHNLVNTDTAVSGINGVDNSGFDLFGEGNPYPETTPEQLVTSQDTLNRFTCYLFDRRFGWSETDTEDGRRVRRMSSTGATMSAGTSKQKAALNTMLDSLIRWYLHQELNQPVVLALKYTIKQTANMPVVRNRCVIHTMDWFKSKTDELCDETFFPVIHDIIVLSVTDVWSAIRNACAGRLGSIASSLSEENVQTLFESFVQICEDDSSWQKKEGAMMGINAVLQRFLNSPGSKSPLSSPRTLDTDTQEKRVPEFVGCKIHSVVFDLLSHSQLTIREHAAKTLATYITCSSIMDALDTLSEVIKILKNKQENGSSGPSRTQQFLDDYASEGFLGVCIFLVKVIPLSYLLPGWPELISTFLLYLSHPASTVRQAASSVFKYLVVKGSHSVIVLKLILQAIAMGWKPDTEKMTAEIEDDSLSVNGATPSVCDFIGTNLCETWEGREGRLFAYELIFRYLIKNHWLYTFGPAGSGLHLDAVSSKESDGKAGPSEPKASSVAGTGGKLMHHVESEKSLAMLAHHKVRFLTQADIREESFSGNKMERMTSVDQDHSSSPDVVGHHHRHSPGLEQNQYNNTCSLLTQAQLLDSMEADSVETDLCAVKQELQLKKLRLLVENNNNNKNSSLACKCGWMEKEYLQDMSRILKVILYQTSESLGHSQWELRRIANQVLPCLAEVIRWYDINLLVTVWNSYLNVAMPTCLMTFTSVLLLKESVIHAVKLIPLLHKPPHSWQDHEKCRDLLSQITTVIRHRLPSYLPHLQYLVQRVSCDRLSVISTDVILVAYTHLKMEPELKMDYYGTVLDFWKRVYHAAHPQTRISTELLHGPHTEPFTSPFEGYLSCCLVKPDNKLQCAKQVEKFFISEIYAQLPAFLESLPLHDVLTILPCLAHYIGQFIEDSHISRTMLECLQTNASKVTQTVLDSVVRDKKLYGIKCILITLRELSAVVAMKSLDLAQVLKVLGVYEELSKPVSLCQHLPVALSAIAARLNEGVEFTVDHLTRGEDDDLYLLSNDIPVSYSDPNSEEDSDPDEVIVGSPGARFPESLTLNTSNNSGSLTGRLSALSCHSNLEAGQGSSTPREESDSEEESSDWDSWDEEEESQSAFGETFSQFLQKLQKINNVEFLAEVKKLGSKEKNVILSLIKS